MMLRSSKGNNWAIIQLVSCMNLVEHNSDLVIVSCDFKDNVLPLSTSISPSLAYQTPSPLRALSDICHVKKEKGSFFEYV